MTAISSAPATPAVRISRHARQRIDEMPDVDEAAVRAAAVDPEWTRADAHEAGKAWHTRGDIRVLVAHGPDVSTVVTVTWATAEHYERGDGHSPRPADLADVPGARRVVAVPTVPMVHLRRPMPSVLTRRHPAYYAAQFATLLAYAAKLARDAAREPDLAAPDMLEAVADARERLDALEYEAIHVARGEGMPDAAIAEALEMPVHALPRRDQPDPRWRAKKLARRLANALGAENV